MAQQNIDFGTFPNDPDADAIRTAFQKVQNNFDEIYATTTVGTVLSVNKGAGIDVNSPTGNVIVTANISSVNLNTNSLKMGLSPSNTSLSANLTTSSQAITIDIDPSNVFSNNFAANSTGGLANFNGTLTANSNSQPNITSLGTLTSLAVTGNVTSGNVYANSGTVGATLLTGTLTTAAQPNITSIGTLGNLNVTSNSNLGNLAVANFFSGDGHLLSNLTISAGSAIVNGNSNVTVSANGNVTTGVAGTANVVIITATGANITGTANISGNLSAGNANLGNAVTANYHIGSGNNLSNIQGANVSGAVANATYAVTAGSANTATSATTAGTVTTAAQPNITSVGTLTSLGVNGTITAVAFTANTGIFTGNGAGLTNIAGANVTGTVANATYAVSSGNANTAGTVTTAAQPSITSVGTLTSLLVGNSTANVSITTVNGNGFITATGNITAPNFIGNLVGNISGNIVVPGNTTEVLFNSNGSANASNAFTFNQSSNVLTLNGNVIAGNVFANAGVVRATTFTGTLTTNAQPNITSLGNLTSLNVNGLTNLGAVGNVTITGGTANYYLMTNGSGGLSWSNALLTPIPGSNTQVLFNDGGSNVNANANLTFNKTTGLLTATLLGGTLTTAAQPNITSVGILTSVTINGPTIANGTFNTANASVTGILTVTANITSPQLISNVATGTAPLVVTSTTQVANLNVATANNASYLGGTAAASYLLTTGTGSSLTAIAGANVTGTVANATYAVSSGSAGTVTTAAQPNITSVGSSLSSSGNIQGANIIATGYHIRSVGTGISAAGSSQGTGTSLTKEMNIVSTVASGAGVVLPAAAPGMVVTITNTSANSLLVYPASGGTINSLSTNAAFTQGTTTIQFIAPTTTQWYTVGATYA